MEKEELDRLKYEIDILKSLSHPNIVTLYEVYENSANILLLTELCDGRELFDEIQEKSRFPEEASALVTKQLLQATAYCHKNNIAHRDLKPENILLDIKKEGTIKVIDFGTSHHYQSDQENQLHEFYGTPYYLAPEIFSGSYNEKCDLWSIGVILYVMLCGSPPFHGDSDEDVLKQVKEAKWSFPDDEIWADISKDAKDLVSKLMNPNPKHRLTAQQALQHKWIQTKVHKKFDPKAATKAFNSLQQFRVSVFPVTGDMILAV